MPLQFDAPSDPGDLQELYQEIVLEHSKRPRNFRVLENPTCSSEGVNPLCGDQVRISLKLEGDVIADIGIEGTGCAISKASASVMSAAIKGKTRQQARELFKRFHDVVTGHPTADPGDQTGLGDLVAFAGVRAFPVRVKCATLAWHALNAALEGQAEPVSTEQDKE